MAAVLADDPSLAAVDGAVDVFSFDARARALAALREKIAHSRAAPTTDASLLARIVDAEVARVEVERDLPRSASALVRALVATWQPPATQEASADRDRWLSRRLTEVTRSLDSTEYEAFDVVRARELDEALDGLERLAESGGLSRAMAALVALRERLEALHDVPLRVSAAWPAVARGLRVHLGVEFTPEALDARLNELVTTLLAALAEAGKGASTAKAAAVALLFGTSACSIPVSNSLVRSMEAPPERLATCEIRRLAASTADASARAHALVVFHDYVTVARWALDVARGTSTLREAVAKHRPLSQPDSTAPWERLAVVQPVVALGAGLAVATLYGGAPSEFTTVARRARAWSELGDVPYDIAELELRSITPP
jgi:hypothetical protein